MRRLALVALLITATGFSGERRHLRLTRSEPSADSSVSQLSAIKLWFSQPVELRVTSVRLTGEGDRPVELAALMKESRDIATPVVAGVPAGAAPGRYTVNWRTMSRDGHAVSGTFAFTLAAPAGTPAHNH